MGALVGVRSKTAIAAVVAATIVLLNVKMLSDIAMGS